MKTIILLISLYGMAGHDFQGIFVTPGLFTKPECERVRAMMDRDAAAGFVADEGDLIKLTSKTACVDMKMLKQLQQPQHSGGPDELLR